MACPSGAFKKASGPTCSTVPMAARWRIKRTAFVSSVSRWSREAVRVPLTGKVFFGSSVGGDVFDRARLVACVGHGLKPASFVGDLKCL